MRRRSRFSADPSLRSGRPEGCDCWLKRLPHSSHFFAMTRDRYFVRMWLLRVRGRGPPRPSQCGSRVPSVSACGSRVRSPSRAYAKAHGVRKLACAGFHFTSRKQASALREVRPPIRRVLNLCVLCGKKSLVLFGCFAGRFSRRGRAFPRLECNGMRVSIEG